MASSFTSGDDLRREQVHLLDPRRLGEQLLRVLHQGGRDRTGEVRLAPLVVGERVEDPELAGPEAQREPDRRLALALGCGKSSFEELRYLRFLPGLGAQTDQQGNSNHGVPPSGEYESRCFVTPRGTCAPLAPLDRPVQMRCPVTIRDAGGRRRTRAT